MQRYARSYLTPEFDVNNLPDVRARFDELGARPLDDLESWWADVEELRAACEQDGRDRHIASSRDTRDADLRERMRVFYARVDPVFRAGLFELERRLLGDPRVRALESARYGELLRVLESSHRVFRADNLPLLADESALRMKFNGLAGRTTVEFEGEKVPLPRMQRFQEDPDRGRRERAWRATAKRLAADAEQYDALFDLLVSLRHHLAQEAGCPNYVAYRFADLGRPYTPADCDRYRRAVESCVVPLLRTVHAERRVALGVASLRPWDLSEGAGARDGDLVPQVLACLRLVHTDFADHLAHMEQRGMLDLYAREGKGPGGFMCVLPERRMPFIFMNAAGVARDLVQLAHEAGHAIHYLEARDLVPTFNRSAPLEFCETVALSIELMVLDESGDTALLRRQLEDAARRMAWSALIDAFQRDVYAHPRHTREERDARWLELFRCLRGDVDWSGLEHAERTRWHRQQHVFRSPLYYIEYGIAQIGALQIWRNYRQDKRAAVRALRRAMALGGARPLPELFAAAGATFEMGDGMLAGVCTFVEEQLRSLS